MKCIAVMNLKKGDREYDGGYSTNLKGLDGVVKRDREFIKQQLEIYAEHPPVVFVCCGPGLLTMLSEHVFNNACIQSYFPIPFIKPYNDREVFFVAFNHPNAKVSGLVEKFQSIRSLLKL